MITRSYFIILTLMLLASCTPDSSRAGQGGTLTGTCWELTHINGTPLPPQEIGGAITLEFDNDGDLFGHTANNHYFSTYDTTGARLDAAHLGHTDVGETPEGIQYFDLFSNVYSYSATNNQLTLYDSTDAAIFEYIAADPKVCKYLSP